MSINLKSKIRGVAARNIILLMLMLILGLITRAIVQPANSAQAQEEELLVTITQVDSQTFPQVMAHVTVSGQNADLTAANFQLFEDGTAIPSTAITVEAETLPALNLVLALDVSMPAELLADLQTAAVALINSLNGEDMVAVIAFQNQVEVIQPFTNNKEELLTAINNLEPQGEASALYEAAFQAAATADTGAAGRKAVIILTNSADNLNQRSIEEAVEQAQADQIPLFAIGLGPRAEPNALNTLAGQTGGQAFIFAGPGEVEATLQKIKDELQRGYRVTFQSGLQANGAEHNLTLNVVQPERGGAGEAGFVATPGQVEVSLPGLAAGQTVTGTMMIAPDLVAPAPIAHVEYRMNDQVLATVSDSPYSFRLDSSTMTAGNQTLIVRAVDRVGNVGETETPLTIAPPLAFEIPTESREVALGEPVNLHIPIGAGAGVTNVEFLLDETVLGTAQTPSYRFTFNSGDHPAGEHTITIRVQDNLGQQAEISYPIAFVAPPATLSGGWFATTLGNGWAWIKGVWFNWWRTVLAVIVVGIMGLVILALGVVWMKTLSTWRQKRYHKKGRLVFRNRGNVPNRYAVLVEDPVGALIFQLGLNGVALKPQPVTAAGGAVPVASPEVAPAGPVTGSPQPAQPAQVTQPAQNTQSASAPQPAQIGQPAHTPDGQAKGAMDQVEDASQRARELTGIARVIISLINMVASILPRSIGGPLRSLSRMLYRPLMQINRLFRLPLRFIRSSKQISKKMDKFNSDKANSTAGTVPPSTAAATSVTPPTATQAASQPTATVSSSTTVSSDGPMQSPTIATSRPETGAAMQSVAPDEIITPFIEPDESLTFDLFVKPVDPYQSRDYVFTVTSKSLQEPEADAITHQKNIHISGVSLLSRYLPFFALLLVMIALLSLVVVVGILIVSLIL